MWVIAVLLLISFALLLSSLIAQTRRMRSVFSYSGIAVWLIICFIGWKTDSDSMVLMNSMFTFLIISHFIARPILRRRITPPCIRAKGTNQSRILAITGSFVATAFWVWLTILIIQSSPSFERIVSFAVFTPTFIIILILIPFEKIEICGNGVWQFDRLHPWEEYESFSWKWKAKDNVELSLVSNSWLCSRRLMVPPEDREAVQQLLEANIKQIYRI